MTFQDFRPDFLAQKNFRFAIVGSVRLKLDDIEAHVVERTSHCI